MANTISTYCKQYVNSQEEKLRMYNTFSLTQDLVKPLVSHSGKIVSYDKLTLASGGIGSYNRATGYTAKDITMTRVDETLSQDKGNSLMLDAMDRDEAQIEGGIIRLYNNYVIKVEIPAVDTYRFSAIAGKTGVAISYSASLTTSTILSALMADKKALANKRVKFDECIIYIGATAKALLDEVALGKGYLSLGNWGGNMDATVEMFKGAKIVEVPDDTLGKITVSGTASQLNWIIVHPLAVDAFVVYQEAEFFDRVPGFGARKKEVDVGIYHDCFVNENCLDGVIVNVDATAPVGA